MKGDLVLLSAAGVAMAAVPAAVLLWAGQPLAGEVMQALPLPLSASTVQAAPEAGSSLPELLSGVVAVEAGTEAGGSSSGADADIDTATDTGAEHGESAAGDGEEDALPAGATGLWHTPVTELRVLDQGTGEVVELSLFQYTQYAIAAEMPADYHLEALKAQGVAALSYALHQAIGQRSLPEEERDGALMGADFAADPGNRLGYMTEEGARKFYGERFDYSWERITEAAREACRCVMLWEGEPIAAAYHAISAGESTEAAENIWGNPLPYLVEAESSWDILAPGYKSTVMVSEGELRGLLESAGAVLLPDAGSWLEIEERSAAGYVTAIRAGSITLSGNQLRDLLGLRSSAFELERTHSGYTFYVRGYGHGAGLSQAGADYLARQGWGFDGILSHYYSGVTIAAIAVEE